MSADVVYLVGGAALLLGVVLPAVLHRAALSAPMVLLAVGTVIGLLPTPGDSPVSPVDHRALTEHLTEFVVIVSLMGVGLALDRLPLELQACNGGLTQRWALDGDSVRPVQDLDLVVAPENGRAEA